MEVTSKGTAQVWRERIISQRASGQSIRAWCRANGCHEHAFYWWRARLGLSPQSVTRRPRPQCRQLAEPLTFAEVVVNHAAAEPMRLRLAGGRELHLPASMPVEHVAKLVRAIEGAA